MEVWKAGEYRRYESFIRDTEKRFDLPRNLLALVLFQASKYDPVTIAGIGQHPLSSIGIAKLTAHDANQLWNEQPADYSQRHDAPTKRKDALASIIGCATLLKRKRWKFGSWKMALLAYHTSDDIALSTAQKGEAMPIDAAEYIAQITAQVRV
jgi:hypothetical protein